MTAQPRLHRRLPFARRSARRASAATDIQALLSGDDAARTEPTSSLGRLCASFRNLADAGAGLFETIGAGRTGRIRWILRQRGSDLDVLRVRRGRAEEVARLTSDDLDPKGPWRSEIQRAETVELRLDPDHLLRRSLNLPADSRDFLKAIVEHRLDRLTPWAADNVVFGYSVTSEHPATKEIVVDFLATSRVIATQALARAAGLGILPTAVGSAADPTDRPVSVDLLSGRGDRPGLRRRKRLRRALVSFAALALAAYVASLYAVTAAQSDLDAVTADLDAERRAVLERSSGTAAQDAASNLIRSKTIEGATFHRMDTLAEIIPDGTFLTDFEINPTALRLKGRSQNAPALVPILEAQDGLSDVRFEAPVIREAGGGDRFDIVAAFAPSELPSEQP